MKIKYDRGYWTIDHGSIGVGDRSLWRAIKLFWKLRTTR